MKRHPSQKVIRAIGLLLVLLLANPSYSQPNPNEETPEKHLRWEPLAGKESIFIRPYFAHRSLDLDITSENQEHLKWEPNVGLTFGSDFYFKDYPSFGLSHSLSGTNTSKYGSSKNTDLRFAFEIKDQYYFQLDLQSYKGFYTHNASDPTTGEKPVKDSSLGLANLSLRNIYVFSPDKFSLEAIRSQTKRQIQSGGSLLTGVYLGVATAYSPNGLIPISVQPKFGTDAALQKIWGLSLLARIGYGYTWVFYPKFFWGTYGLLGLGANQTYLNYGSARSSRSKINFGADANFFTALGYTGDIISTSISIDNEAINLPGIDASFSNGLTSYAFNLGCRF